MRLVSYFGNLYLDAFKLHVDEIKSKGFDTILFCITETDLLYNLLTFQEFRQYAESQGLKVWATFWGLTAGEAITKDADVEKWLYAVKSIGFTDVMVDEPKSLSDIYRFTDNDFLTYHLCLCDATFNTLTDQQLTELPVKSLGVSCYHWCKNWGKITMRTAAICTRLVKLRQNNFIFIQGFDIPQGFELLPQIVKEVAEISGIYNFAFWAFRSCEATASKRPVNHRWIWDSISFCNSLNK